MREFDLIIIGSGSGNSILTEDFDGLDVAIVDGGTFGGVCLNVGCIPTKMYVYPATLARHAVEADRLGVRAEVRDVRWREMRDRIFGRIDAISHGGLEYRRTLPNVTVVEERVRFTGPRTLRTASGHELTSRQIVVAAGSRPVVPDVPGIDLPQVHTSDTVMRIDELPRRVVVVGGGYIGAEFAHMFSSLGSRVTQVNRSHRILRYHDPEIAQRFAREASRQWKLEAGWSLAGVEESAGDGSAVTVTFHDPEDPELTMRLPADVVLVATGRQPNTDVLDARAGGLDVREDGLLAVDEFQHALHGGEPVEGVWALGDICSPYQLKHVANAEARTVQHNLLHPEDLRATDHRFVPSAVFTSPQIASVGMTQAEAEDWAVENGTEITVKVQDYGATAYGWAMEDHTGLCKIVAEKGTGRLLGAHLIGEEASLLIQPLVQAMSFGVDAHAMARGQYWIHPALSEVVENALLGLDVPEHTPLPPHELVRGR
ncbi:mycothione reductase [Kocuria sp. M1R5S2]|uniref:mycothione reductase n=1 Tax=Kocuria rhizosphaerae TaxID=3376285 RepID=UPI00379751E5